MNMQHFINDLNNYWTKKTLQARLGRPKAHLWSWLTQTKAVSTNLLVAEWSMAVDLTRARLHRLLLYRVILGGHWYQFWKMHKALIGHQQTYSDNYKSGIKVPIDFRH